MLWLAQWSASLWLPGGWWALGWVSSSDDTGDGGGRVIAINAGDGDGGSLSLSLVAMSTLMVWLSSLHLWVPWLLSWPSLSLSCDNDAGGGGGQCCHCSHRYCRLVDNAGGGGGGW